VNDLAPHRLFIASPRDLPDERAATRHCVDTVNRRLVREGLPSFDLVGWEIVSGTAERPQEAINELIHQCDFLLAIFKSKWGGSPGGPRGFTSGTEEEIFEALLDLADENGRIRDLWIAFANSAEAEQPIIEFKAQIVERNALLYETFSSTPDLLEKLTARLLGWAPARHRRPRHVPLLPRSGKDMLGADKLRRDGERLVSLGYPGLGIPKLREAADIGGPNERLAYSRALARQGEHAAAHEVVDLVIQDFAEQREDLHTPTCAEAFMAKASLLRRDGDYLKSVLRLEAALGLLRNDDAYTKRIRARILDDMGLAHQKLGNYDTAREILSESLSIRTEMDDAVLVAQSEVNLARNDVAHGDLDSAAARSLRAVDLLKALPPTTLYANAQLLRAQTLLRIGDANEAIRHALIAEAVNAQFGSKYGQAMSYNVLAQCHRRAGDVDAARSAARRSLELNEEVGNARVPPVVSLLVNSAGADQTKTFPNPD
jgi:tetratricopeptide (TPR) repeat protein